MSVIGKQIKKYRNQKKYTQEKLGSLIGVTTQAVSKMGPRRYARRGGFA